MLVKQDVHCADSGTTSTVYLPFALYFTGYAPHETGTVSAYTQPGNERIGTATITLDSQGSRCVEVVGQATPGQYKIVYDFGSGTGKQKVIRLVDAPGASHTPTPAPTPTSASPSTTSASPTTTSASPSTTSASPTTTSASPSTTSASPSTTSASPSDPGGTASPSPSESDHVEFIPENLAPTGSSGPSPLPGALVLLAVGGLLVLVSGRSSVATADRRH
jgi:hypothetical protein